MLDQNTDRMWYVIGAVIIGAAIILILNNAFPQLFASVGETFQDKTEDVGKVVDDLTITDGVGPVHSNENLILESNTNLLMNYSDYNGVDGRVDNRNLTVIKYDQNGEKYFSATSTGNGTNVYGGNVIKTSEARVSGETYTMSFDLKTEQSQSWAFYFYTNDGQDVKQYHIPSTNGDWIRYSYTFIQKETRTYPILFGFGQMQQGEEFGWRKLKLEKGNKATPWRVANSEAS